MEGRLHLVSRRLVFISDDSQYWTRMRRPSHSAPFSASIAAADAEGSMKRTKAKALRGPSEAASIKGKGEKEDRMSKL